jgi:hypothetical protein
VDSVKIKVHFKWRKNYEQHLSMDKKATMGPFPFLRVSRIVSGFADDGAPSPSADRRRFR